MKSIRTGIGFDVHKLETGAEFWLGGIKLDHHKGAVGHSDADVLIHAICDALLGAAALGDIGKLFPDTDDSYKGIDSKILLREVMKRIRDKGYEVSNVDSVVALQQPKIKPHIDTMRVCLAKEMKLDVDQVSVKATTTEKMGFEGREEGVSAYASVLIYKTA